MSSITLRAAVVSLCLALGACATTSGHPFDTDAAQRLVDGKTTQSEVRQQLGDPQTAQDNGDGTTLWLYSNVSNLGGLANFNPFSSSGPHPKSQSLQLTFDRSGRLASHTMTEINQ